MATLYITKPGARIEKEYHRILVTMGDEVLLRVPIQRISQVVLVGRVGATTPAMQALLRNGVPLMLVARTGKLIGRLLPPTAKNLPLRQLQFRKNENIDFCLNFARSIVVGKIRNQRGYLQRLYRRRKVNGKVPLEKLEKALKKAGQSNSLSELLGVEGNSAKIYFIEYRKMFLHDWDFSKRVRRPPKDPVNSLLSLGYTFLGHAMMASLEIVGLDPFLGYFHVEKYGRPALALDLIEAFRTPIVDSLVVTLLNRRTLQQKDFQTTKDGAVYLRSKGMEVFLRKFNQRLETAVKAFGLKRSLSYHKLFEVQARKLVKLLEGEVTEFQSFRLR